MKIFLARISNLLKSIDKDSFLQIHNSPNKNIESNIALLLSKYIAHKIYGISKTEIIRIDEKPEFKYFKTYFSISHSKGIIGIAFSQSPIGFDIEKIKKRNLIELSKFLNIKIDTLIDFYQYWTIYEAKYKSGLKNSNVQSGVFEDYVFSVSALENSKMLKIYEISNPIDNTSPIELINLKLVNDNNIKDIKLDIKEIKTGGIEYLPPLAIKTE